MPTVGSIGNDVLHYNGVTFFIYASKVTAKPVYDSAGRTVRWVEHEISVERALVDYTAPDTSTDNTLEAMRMALTKPGQVLIFEHKGYGSLSVNVPGSAVRDADFGPKPALLDWIPAGNDQAAIVAWKCTVCIPECDGARFQNAIAEHCHTVEHRLDTDGYPVVAVAGHIVIPMTRLPGSDSKLPDHVDRYRERIQTPVPLGFQRRNPIFHMNEAKTRLDYSWEDAGLSTPPPLACTKCDVTHRVESPSGGGVHLMWENSLTATIHFPPQVDKAFAWLVFAGILADRLRAASAATVAAAAQAVEQMRRAALQAIQQGNIRQALDNWIGVVAALGNRMRLGVVPGRLSIDNEVAGRSVKITYSWRALFRQPIAQALVTNGIWRGFPGTSFEDWRRSMDQLRVTTVRGPAGLAWSPSDDAIIDLCLPAPPAQPRPRQRAPRPDPHRNEPPALLFNPGPAVQVGGGAGAEPGGGGSTIGDLTPGSQAPYLTLPNPEASFVKYANRLIYTEPRGRYARHRPLTGAVHNPRVPVDAAGKASQLGKLQPGQVSTATQTTPDILQEVNAPAGVVYLRGEAVRIGADIPLPNLLTCRGCTAVRNRVVRTAADVIGRMGDIPIIYRAWDIEFLLNTPPPGPLPFLSNPLMGVNGGSLT